MPADRTPAQPAEPTDLGALLDRIEDAAEAREQVSVNAILDTLGHRSFGPVLLVAGLITLAPLVGDIPGVPSLMAALVILTAGQLILRRRHIWLPRWLLDRSVSRSRLCRALGWLRRPARFVDRLIRPRLVPLTRGAGAYLVAAACILIALAMPPMELVPFSANGAGAGLSLFGLGLIARDGVLVLIALAVTGGTFALVIQGLV